MRYRKISADKIFDGFRFLEKDIVVIVNEDGRIENTVDKTVAGEGIEHYKGILSPGFINSHCHLELSHMKAVIPPGTGLVDFLINVVTKRSQKEESFILQRIELLQLHRLIFQQPCPFGKLPFLHADLYIALLKTAVLVRYLQLITLILISHQENTIKNKKEGKEMIEHR